MKILVTGAGGFIGRHLVPALLGRGHDIIALSLRAPRGDPPAWLSRVQFIAHDLRADAVPPAATRGTDAAIHLAWPGLPNYGSFLHFEEHLPAAYRFVKRLVEAGIPRIQVAGTCWEYGLRNGELSEDMPGAPANPYALGKHVLHRFLDMLRTTAPFELQWVRLFYMYGEGQNPKSLLAMLDQAIARGDASFDMSAGEQLRDYLPVEDVARRLAFLAEHPESGIFNCCSGIPVSVRALAERRVAERGSSIKLNLGRYPYSPLEPMAFWGSTKKTAPIFARA